MQYDNSPSKSSMLAVIEDQVVLLFSLITILPVS